MMRRLLEDAEEIWQPHSSPDVYWAIFFTGPVAQRCLYNYYSKSWMHIFNSDF